MSAALLTAQQQSVLAERIRQRESSAEEDLVRLFSERVMFLALARTRDREVARDVAQDAMLTVIRALREGQLRDAERLAAFVYGIARNLINNYIRTQSRFSSDAPLEDDVRAASVPDPVEARERAFMVRQCLGMVDSTDRKILLLTLVEGLKPGEIASRLDLTSEVVRARKSRALRKITERLKTLSRR